MQHSPVMNHGEESRGRALPGALALFFSSLAACLLLSSWAVALVPPERQSPADAVEKAAPEDSVAARPTAVGSSLTRVYRSELPLEPYSGFLAHYLLFNQVAEDMTPEGYVNGKDVIDDLTWDFSAQVSPNEATQTFSPPGPAYSCYSAMCGFDHPGLDSYLRLDAPLDFLLKGTMALDWDEVADTLWVRGAVFNEEGGFEKFRLCGDPDQGHKEIPLLVFGQSDANGVFMEVGDTWATETWTCDPSIWLFGGPCGAGDQGLLNEHTTDPIRTGDVKFRVLHSGVLSPPSGHHFNALLVEANYSFSIYETSCIQQIGSIGHLDYLWIVPKLGIVARMGAPWNLLDPDTWNRSVYTMYGMGLFPPVDIRVADRGSDWIRVEWDPGNHTQYIDRFKVYWDTDSGADTPYAFDSDANPGRVTFDGNAAVISGIPDCGDRFITVTALYSHTDPASGEQTEYESLLYPEQVYGDPDHAYPIEVTGAADGGVVVDITSDPAPPVFCENGAGTLTASPGFDTYEWSDGQTGQQATFDVSQDTRMTVAATDARECVAEASIDIRVDHPPDFATAAASDQDPCDPGVRITWDPAVFLGPSGGTYNVYRSEVSCADALTRPPIETEIDGTEILDPTPPSNVALYYLVEAEDGRSGSPCDPTGWARDGAATRVCISTPVTDAVDDTPPDSEVGNTLRAVDGSHTWVEFTWSVGPPLDADEVFWVGRSTDPSGGFVDRSDGTLVDPAFVDDAATPARLYFYDVLVSDDCENLSRD